MKFQVTCKKSKLLEWSNLDKRITYHLYEFHAWVILHLVKLYTKVFMKFVTIKSLIAILCQWWHCIRRLLITTVDEWLLCTRPFVMVIICKLVSFLCSLMSKLMTCCLKCHAIWFMIHKTQTCNKQFAWWHWTNLKRALPFSHSSLPQKS